MKIAIEPGGCPPQRAREQLAELLPQVVSQPSSTRLLRTRTASGKVRFLVVDHRLLPVRGSLVVYRGDEGPELLRYRQTTPLDRVWGTVVWCLQEV